MRMLGRKWLSCGLFVIMGVASVTGCAQQQHAAGPTTPELPAHLATISPSPVATGLPTSYLQEPPAGCELLSVPSVEKYTGTKGWAQKQAYPDYDPNDSLWRNTSWIIQSCSYQREDVTVSYEVVEHAGRAVVAVDSMSTRMARPDFGYQKNIGELSFVHYRQHDNSAAVSVKYAVGPYAVSVQYFVWDRQVPYDELLDTARTVLDPVVDHVYDGLRHK